MFPENLDCSDEASPNCIPLQSLSFNQQQQPATNYNFNNGGKAKTAIQQTTGQFLSLTKLPTGLACGHNTGTIYKYGMHGWSQIYHNNSQQFTALTTLGDDTLVVGLGYGGFFTFNLYNNTRIDLGSAGSKITSIAATQGDYIATLDVNRQAKIWSTTPLLTCIAEFANCNSIIAHENYFIYHADNQPVRIWDCNTKNNTPVELPIPNGEKIFCMASLETNFVACGSSMGKLYIWNTSDGQSTTAIPRANVSITQIAAFPDYAAIVCLDNDGIITILDYQISRVIETICPKPDPRLKPELLCAMPGGKFAATKGGIYFDVYNLPHLQTRSSWCSIL